MTAKKLCKVLALFFVMMSSFNIAKAEWIPYQAQLDNITTVPEFADVTWSMKQPDFWISKISAPGKLMFNDAEIKELNKKLRSDKNSLIVDFNEYPKQLKGSVVLDLIKRLALPSDLKYVKGKRVTYGYYQQLDENRNLSGVRQLVTPIYALTVRQTDLRALPTSDRIYNNPSNDVIDRFQETRLDPGEPVVVLHTSRDGNWSFVQSFCYAAWVKNSDIGLVNSRDDWDNYRNSEFITVKIPDFCMRDTDSREVLVWEMGAKIIRNINHDSKDIDNYVVLIPTRSSNGMVDFKLTKLPRNTVGIREGYLPCSYQNIIYQAFKMYGMKFGWGGLYDSVDCSSFAQNVYRSFGIIIPRNSGQQAKMPVKTTEFYGLGGRRYEELSDVSPGSILFMPGHIMIYLGEENQKHYIIHSFSSFGVLDRKRGLEENPVYAVAVTSMNLYRLSGRTFQDSVNLGKTIK